MTTPRRMAAIQSAIAPFVRFVNDSFWRKRYGDPAASDFVFGNPHEMPLEGVVAALQRAVVPRHTHWFAYKWSEPEARAVVARALRRRLGLRFDDDDILLTNGAYAGLSVSLCSLLDPGDEVIFLSPPWFFYEALIVAYGGTPIRVGINLQTFDLDLAAIEAALTLRTRAIIINTPHNPTGKIYPPETLSDLADLLTAASDVQGRPIFIISDEAYSRIVFDARSCPSPAQFYPHTLLIYTYGKTLLTPGQRIGYIALPPHMPERQQMRTDVFTAQLTTGFAFPNALLQYALGDLEELSIDIADLQRKRDRLVAALRNLGYRVHSPEGTFYVLAGAPGGDDEDFCERLAAHDVFCLPGTVVEMPGYFRISLTASDEMIDRALPGFAAAIEQAVAGRHHRP